MFIRKELSKRTSIVRNLSGVNDTFIVSPERMRSSKSCMALPSFEKKGRIVYMEEVKRVQTSGFRTGLSLISSLWAPTPFLLADTRDIASGEIVASRSLEGRNILMAFPFSSEVLSARLSERADPERAPDAADSDERRDRDCDSGSGDWPSRVSSRSGLEKDLLR
jgi:hypothetical protein